MTFSHRSFAILLLGAVAACGRPQPAGPPPPASPEATVDQFLAAVNADDLRRMAQLFGDERGPYSETVHNAETREKLMAILQRVLLGDSARVTGSEPVPGAPRRRVLHLTLFREGAARAFPVTCYQQESGGWLVANVPLNELLPGGSASPSGP